MASEYEVKDIGYIGSLWQGQDSQPIYVGRTLQVINNPNTILYGFGGTKVAAYFADKTNVDLDTFNRQYPQSTPQPRYSVSKLPEQILRQIESETRISYQFLKNLDVIQLKAGSSNISVPIGDENSWGSFQIFNSNTVKWVLSDALQYLTYYVFLLTPEELRLASEYFSSVQSQQYTWQDEVIADPTEYITLNTQQPVIEPPLTVIDFSPEIIQGRFLGNPVPDVILDILSKIPFPSKEYQNDIQEDMVDFVAEVDAAEEFIELLSQPSAQELFYVSATEGDEEYNRLTDLIKRSIEQIQIKYVEGYETGGPTPVAPENLGN